MRLKPIKNVVTSSIKQKCKLKFSEKQSWRNILQKRYLIFKISQGTWVPGSWAGLSSNCQIQPSWRKGGKSCWIRGGETRCPSCGVSSVFQRIKNISSHQKHKTWLPAFQTWSWTVPLFERRWERFSVVASQREDDFPRKKSPQGSPWTVNSGLVY